MGKGIIFREVIPGSSSRLITVDHKETYGRHILKKAIKNLLIEKCVDLGCGNGDDLMIVKEVAKTKHLIGIDYGLWNADTLQSKGINIIDVNLEQDVLPFADNSVDLIIANQVLEHCKEIFWINHEIFRCLRPNGHLFLGVPNILSFHNRILGLFGFHPTQHKLLSAHVRPFSKKDIILFYEQISGGKFSKIKGVWGSQFYPFPRIISRPLSTIFPSMSFSIFFLIEKCGEYNDEFLAWTQTAKLETNYYIGDNDI
jgi:ubiquinone/menaquinone biosynthesis C-methylase UbiE